MPGVLLLPQPGPRTPGGPGHPTSSARHGLLHPRATAIGGCLPAVAAGAATRHYGLGAASHAFAITAALLALAALAALTASRRGAPRPEADRSS
ncbi:hypothetical protein ACFUTV_20995 [Streptomyces sp. NPDC057298]|uniref:hypothetical protein n=1 Tax=Streptomyces sp. NPDC057298 TaxID=3346091 RepID=UPI00362681D0